MPFSYDIDPDDSARAKRRRQSHQRSQSIDVKALGSNLGALARGTAMFDPNAYDGDGDGLVQDNTPFERPAVLSNVAALSRGLASATGKWGNDYQGWTVGKTNEEIADTAIPSNPAELVAYVTAHVGAYGLLLKGETIQDVLNQLPLDKVDFTPETVAKTRQALVDTLNEYPQLRELIDRFGIPAIAPIDEDSSAGTMYGHVMMSIDTDTLASYGTRKQRPKSQAKWLLDRINTELGVDIDHLYDNEVLGAFVDERLLDQLNGVFVHEYGHYLVENAILNHPDPAFRQMLYVLGESDWKELTDVGYAEKYNIPEEWTELAEAVRDGMFFIPTEIDEDYRIEDSFNDYQLIPPSIYSMADPSEMMAEMFTNEFIDKGYGHVNSKANKEFFRRLTGNTGGFASVSTTVANDRLSTMNVDEIVKLAIPDSPERAREAMEDWAQWAMDLMGEDWFDIDSEGMSASDRVKLDLKRSFYYLEKYNGKGSKWQRALKKARKHKGEIQPEDVFDFSPEMIENARVSLTKALNEQPLFLDHVRTFGMPPVFVTKSENDNLGAYFNGSMTSMNIVMNRKLLVDPETVKEADLAEGGVEGTEWFLEANGKWTPHSTFGHEYGHYLNFLSSYAHPDREARYLNGWYWRMSWDEVNPKGIKGWRYKRKWEKWREKNPTVVLDTGDKRWRQSAELERAITKREKLDWENGPPHVLSEYGQSSPAEMFAEGYSAYVSNDPDRVARVSPALKSDIEMTLNRTNQPEVSELVIDTEQSDKPGGFASLSITRNEDGTRDMARAFSGDDDSPLNGSDWLKDATPREIAQALVPRSKDDVVNLSILHNLNGERNPDPHALAALKEYIDTMIDHDLFDFSPEGVARMEEWLEKTLNESPQFLWQVRRFGSAPFIPTNPQTVKKYRDARQNGQSLIVPSTGARNFDVSYPLKGQRFTDQEALGITFDAVVDSEGVLGFNALGLFTVINIHHREWRGLFNPQRSMPRFGRTRRVSMGKPKPGDVSPFPETDMLGRDLISNFSTSLEGTIIHEYHHGWFSSLFGVKSGMRLAPQLRQRVIGKYGLGRDDIELMTGDRYSRARYFFPNLPEDEAVARMSFAKSALSQGSLSIVPEPSRQYDTFMAIALDTARVVFPGSSVEMRDIESRLKDYKEQVAMRGFDRIVNTVGVADAQMMMLRFGLDPRNPDHMLVFGYQYGWDPVENESMWRGLAEDYPQVFGDARMPFSGVAGQYAQKNPQETWAELGALMSQPDADYRDEYITPEMTAAYLYILGEHSDPYDTNNMNKPWEQNRYAGEWWEGPEVGYTRGFGSASRARRVEHARATVTRRSSNSIGNVVSSATPVEKERRVVSSSRGTEGHTYFSVGDYKFKIPGDRFMPELSRAYTEWASESHYDIQQMSGMMMGIQRPSDNPSFMIGNRGIARLLNGDSVTELDNATLDDIRSSVSNTKRMIDEIRNADNYSSTPLYHTMVRMSDNNDILKAATGDDIYLPLTSFTPQITNVNDVEPISQMDGGKSAIVKLAIGASVIDSNLLDNVNHNGEWRDTPIESITGGRFKVVSRTERDGIPVIEVEHSAVFDADSGDFVDIDESKAMSSIRDAVSADRKIRDIQRLARERNLVEGSDPKYNALTNEINTLIDDFSRTAFPEAPEPIMRLPRSARERLMREADIVREMPFSSMDKVGLPGFASTSREFGFDRTVPLERRVAKSAIRTLEDNREYIEDLMMSGRRGNVLDGEWIDRTIENLRKGEISHSDAMDLMNLVVYTFTERMRKDPSLRDAREGDVYHYQKLAKRLRRAMVQGVSEDDLNIIRREQGIPQRGPRPQGFASASSNVREDIVGRFNPTVRTREPYGGAEWGPDERSKNVAEVIVYDINGEKVVFGVEDRHKIDTSDVKNVPLNPYEISGLERNSEEGDKLALDWLYAHIGSETGDEEGSKANSTEMSALLYAAVNGDEDARREFDRYAAEGKKIFDQLKSDRLKKSREEVDRIRQSGEFKQRLDIMKRTMLYFRKKRDTGDTYISDEEVAETEITTKDLVLVRWTQFAPDYDEEGNLVLGTPSDYIDVDRETIHFTLNHAVEEHMFWQEGDNGGYLIMIPLSDVLEDNGVESLGNLYGVDTYFTPKPGQRLKLRKGSVVVKDVKPGEDRKAIALDAITGEFGTFGVTGGPHYTGFAGFDDLVATFADDLGLEVGTIHESRGHKFIEAINNRNSLTGGDEWTRIDPTWNNNGVFVSTYNLSDVDKNTLLRHIDRRHGKPTGVSIKKIDNPNIRSFVSVSKNRRDLSRDINDPERADVVRALQNRVQGFASRTDAVNPNGKSVEQIADELELTPEEKDSLAGALPDYDQLKELVVNPAITPEQKQEIIDSIRVRVDDGVTYITTDPNPLVIDEIPDKRDWSTVVAPSRERQEEIRDLLERIGERVDVTDRETADQVEAKTKLNNLAFSEWLMKKWRAIGDKHPVPVEESHLGTGIYGGGYVPTGMTIYFHSLYDLNASKLLDFFGDDDFLNAHDLWGHAAIGRGFDRHGEWANMLAMFSLMDKWAEDNNIPESDILKMKGSWFRDLEYVRFNGSRFMRGRDETSPNSTREWYDREVGISDALGGMATDEELKELIGLLDHGRVHDSSSSKGFASITRDEKASIVKHDIVRQSKRIAELDMPIKGEETGEAIVKEMGLTGKAAKIAKEAFNRSLESISSGRLKRYKFAKGVDEHKSRLIDSIRIVISGDDVPMIMSDPHPVFFTLLNDRRDWSKIEVPSDETVAEFLNKLKEGNNPISYRDEAKQRDASSGYDKFSKWANAKIKSLMDSAERQDVPSRLRGSLLDETIDDELRIFEGPSSWVNLFVGSMVDGKNAMGGAEDVFDLLHEAIGHVAIGRGFDRHGEYANGLAVLSMLKHPEVKALLTEGEIQQVARHIMSNYLVDRLEQARPNAVASVLDDEGPYPYNRSRMGELMRLVREYDGDIWDMVDILEKDVDKTTAFRADGSPIEPRPKGFASRNRSTLENATGQDLARIVNADAKHTGFASKSADFKGNTHGIETQMNAPEADMFAADDQGRIMHIVVDVGPEVVNPRTGEKMVLNSPSAATQFIADGGDMSLVPDAYIIESVLENTEDLPGERRSGWRFSKPGGRFEWLGGGGGASGMMRFKDRKTNAQFGIKFEASFRAPDGDRYGEWTQPYPITDYNAADAPTSILNEVIGQSVIQALGFEPGATRIVRRSPKGAGKENSGLALIVDFVQNRHKRTRDAEDYAPLKVRKESALRMLLLDAVLYNTDRNQNNFFTTIQSDGTRALIPIDHGQVLEDGVGEDLFDSLFRQLSSSAVQYDRIFEDMTKEEFVEIIPKVLADYRKDIEEKKASIVKSMNEALEKMIMLSQKGDIGSRKYLESLYELYNKQLNAMFLRLDEISSMSDEEFLEFMKYFRIGTK